MAEQITVVMDVIAKMDNAEAGFKKLQGALQKFKLPDNLDSGFKKSFANIESLFAKYKSQLEKGFETKADVSSFVKTSKAIDAELDRLSKHFTELTGKEIDFRIKTDEVKRAEKDIADLALAKEKFGKDTLQLKVEGIKKDELSSVRKALEELQRLTKGNTGKAAGNILEGLDTGNIQQVKKGMDDLLRSFRNVKSEAKLIDIKKAFGLDITDVVTKIINTLRGVEGEMDTFNQKTREASDNLQQVKGNQIAEAGEKLGEAANECERLRGETQKTTAATQEYARATQSMSQQLGDLQQTTQYFFSLRNMINLFKRGVDDAVQSVKELDKAMTETAVVTDFSVADMWKDLPKYTQIANDLGATTQGAYETMTLYYQQGLNQQQAFELGAETMKMARIAGLDYAETTDMMTAALRGFNMELDETSAKRINDVYSKIAAVTASDTEELGTAMQRTASIAHSAGMSFEGTTAFLAQAIETTREPAENLGTAMKTIVARFQEMKKNPLEITEVDGEEVSYNKVDQALQSIGVSLKDTNGQFRELDQVFLDISARWDSLSQTQQRYIATTAAGSRQQSRFIAMMDNYERTMQLMEAANNSAGASDEQFGKTMDSLESKLNKLHNAWQQFTMGIANNAMIKTAVDGLTGFLNITNKLVDKLSLGIGPLKSIISLFAAFTGLKAGGKFINSLIGGLGGLLDPQSSFTKGWLNSSRQNNVGVNNAQAQAISNPIVQAIHQLQSAITHTPVTTNNQTGIAGATNASSVLYKNVNSAIRQALNTDKLTGSGLIKHLEGLDKTSQRVTMANLTGTQRNLNQNLLGQYGNSIFKKSMPAIQTAFKRIDQKVADESISFTEGYAAKISPKALLEHLDMINADEKALANSISTGLENARQKALEKAVKDRAAQKGRRLEDNELAGAIRAFAKEDEGKRVAAKAEEGFILDPKIIRTPMQQAMDNLGKFGSGLSGAGMAITSFGSILTSTGIPGVQELGMVISKIGSGITALGTALSGATAAVVAFTDSTTASAMANFIKNPITIAVAAAAAAILALAAVIKMNNKKIQEAAEKITTDYTEKSSKAKENISNLKQYQKELENLSSGVDERGLNINLDTTDYERYREIVNSIAEMNPSIVKGYNAQGDAIIDNNTALQETLKLQEQINQQATQEYIDPHSLDKLIKARDLNEAFFDPKSAKTGLDADPTRQAAKHLISLFKRSHVQDEFLNQFGLSYDQLAKDENNAIYRFISNHDVMMNSLRARYQATGRDLSQSLIDGFGNLSDAYDAQQEAIEPLYQNLLAYASDKRLTEKFSTEMATTFNQGLKSIASTRGASGTDMQGAVDKLASLMNNVVGSSKEYQDILSRIKTTQKEWAQDLNDDTYTNQIQDEVDALKDLAQQQRDVAEEADNLSDAERQAYYAMADFLDNQALQALKYIDKTVQDLSSTFNEFSQSITNAGNAYENFENRMENIDNYGDGVKSYKQIYDEIFEETEDLNGRKQQLNIEGIGRPEAWIAAESFFTSDWLSGKDINAVVDRLKEIGPLLEEGQTGAVAFGDAIRNSLLNDKGFKERFGDVFSLNPDGSVNIAENLEPAMMEHIARYWGIQEDLLVSFFNNARQYLPEFTFASSNADIRTALAADTRAYNNTDTGAIFVNRDTLVEAFQQGGTYAQDVIDKRIADLGIEEQVYAIPDLDKDLKLSKEDRDYMTNTMGINKENFVDALAPLLTGDEMELYAGQIFDNGAQWWKDEGEGLYNTWSANQESLIEDLAPEEGNELPTIASSVSNIEAMMTADLYRSGQMEDTSSLDQMHRAIFGNEGWDTSIQKLKHGADLDLTKEQFEQYYSDATAAVSALSKAEADLNAGRLQAIQDYGESSEQVKRYDEAIQQVQSDLQYAKGAIEDADNYVKDKDWYQSNEIDTSTYTQQLGYLMQGAFGQLFDSIDPSIVASNPEAQTAIANLYKAVTSNTQPAIDEIAGDLQTLGISIEDALRTGLAFDLNAVSMDVEQKGKDISLGVENDVNNLLEKANEEVSKAYKNAIDSNPIDLSEATPVVKQGADTISGIAQGATAGTLKIDTGDSDQKLDTTQQKATEVINTVNQGATFTIDVPGMADLNKVARTAQSISKNAGKQTVGVKASFDSKAVQTGINTIKSMTPKIPVGADTSKATSEAERARKIIDSKSATINVSTKVTGQYVDIYVTKHIDNDNGPYTGGYITTGGVLYRSRGGIAEYPGYPKKGTDRIPAYLTPGEYVQNRKAVQYFGIDFMRKINHRDLTGALQSFGSAAKGKLGRLGPKNRGGMTLTGELGYEIAWLPSENRSIILGAKGPQMVNLPKDATVYNHEQSKEIMKKRKGISAGSMWGGGTLRTTASGGYSSRSTDSTQKVVKDTAKTVQTAAKATTQAATTVNSQAGFISTYWENAAHRVDALQKKIDRSLDNIDKKFKTFGTTLNSMKGTIASYKTNLKTSIAINEDRRKRAQDELGILAFGRASKTFKDVNVRYDKKQISYETKNKEGKTVTKKEVVSLAPYIKFNKDYSTYELDTAALKQVAKTNISMAKALKEAAESALSDRKSKLKTAEDAIKKAQEALEKVSNDVYQTFYAWEKSINRVYLLSQKLEILNAKLTTSNAKLDLQFSKMEAGTTKASVGLNKVTAALKNQSNLLQTKANASYQNLLAKQTDYQKSLTLTPYLNNYVNNKDSTDAKNQYLAAFKALKFLDQANLGGDKFDYNKAISYLNSQQMTKNEYEAIKSVLDGIFEKQNAFLDAQSEAYQSINEIYQAMEEYQSFIVEFENNLLSGIEEQAEDQIQRLDKLNSSLTKAYKDLLDEVKRKLDERRKQEDNAKTETDISKKQQRLAALQADTAGGHAVEIAQLQKEIAEAQQNYQRSLEDQLIEKLQNQGDEAERQRQRQIELLEAQKEIADQTGTNLEQVKQWLQNPQANYEAIRSAWLTNQGYEDATPNGRKQLEQQFEVEFAKYQGYSAQLKQYQQMVGSLTSLETSVDKIVNSVATIAYNSAQLHAQKVPAKTLFNAGWSADVLAKGGYSTKDIVEAGYKENQLRAAGITPTTVKNYNKQNPKNPISLVSFEKAGFDSSEASEAGYTPTAIKKVYGTTQKSTTKKSTTTTSTKITAAQKASAQKAYKAFLTSHGSKKGKYKGQLTAQQLKTHLSNGKIGYNYAEMPMLQALANTDALTWVHVLKAYKNLKGKKIAAENVKKYFGSNPSSARAKGWKAAFGKTYPKYATGGLADSTGPAWLDGTPSKPELVLNAKDTQNFIALKDVLAKAMNSMGDTSNTYGDIMYEININVDKIEKDYDVDRVVEKVKKEITKGAGYRNVTQVRNFR